jgi:hypothetical protein
MASSAKDGPRRKACRSCGEEILLLHVRGAWVGVEVREFEPVPGQRLPQPAIGLGVKGATRYMSARASQGRGEAVHRVHACAVALGGELVEGSRAA